MLACIAKMIYGMRQVHWTFWEFQTLGGRGVISEWVESLGVEGEEQFHGLLRNLAVSPRGLWTRPAYAPFGPGIGEIRFKADQKQHRVFGCFLFPFERYVLLVGATKKGRNYTPRDAIETAHKRYQLIQRDRSQTREYTDYRF